MPTLMRTLLVSAAVLTFSGVAAQAAGFAPDAPTARPAAITLAATGGETQVAAGATAFVDGMAKKTVQFLADKSMTEAQKKAQFRTLLFADFDLDTIGRFVLGTYWNQSTPQQRQDYLGLFREMIARVWANRFEGYNGQTFQVRGARADDDRDTIVSSVIIPPANQGAEVQVDWRVRYKNGQYKIVEGVSLSVTQRSDFSSVVQRGGGNVQALIDSLHQQIQ